MKEKIFVHTENVKEFLNTAGRLTRVEAGLPGMALVHGKRGLGKTSAAIYYTAQKANNGIYVRGKRDWNYSWMMDDLLIEVGVTPIRGSRAKYDALVNALETPRLIVVDETNLVAPRLLETLRAVHDFTGAPFLFVGHEGVEAHLQTMGPFHDRLLYKTELKPLSLADLKIYCAEALEMDIDADALAAVLKAAGGNFRRSVVLLKSLEDKAKLGGHAAITGETLKGVL